eukprot:gene52678-64373_t
MFKKILQSLTRSQSAKTPPPPAMTTFSSATRASRPNSVLDKIVRGAPLEVTAPRTPEELCEITPKMPKDQIQARLKLLYRRYNRCASSLDAQVRNEAERMLNAIVELLPAYDDAGAASPGEVGPDPVQEDHDAVAHAHEEDE